MATGKCQLPVSDSFPALLLTMIALSGEFPAALVGRLSSSESYAALVVKRLKRDNLIRTYYRNSLRGLRLTATAKKLLSARQPDQFLPLFTGDTITNAPKYTIVHRLRLHRMAEALVAMYNAGVSVFPWEKPVVFAPTQLLDEPDIERPTYYSSREVKNLGLMANKIRGSRSTGILLAPHTPADSATQCSTGSRLAGGDVFVVYSTSSSQIQWEYKAEIRLKSLLQIELCQCRLPAQFMNAGQSAILLGSDMDQMSAMIGVGSDNRQSYFLSGESFPHFYYLANDNHGDMILHLLCHPEKRETLDCILSEDLDPPRLGFVVENDAMNGDTPVLFAYTCDMPRIKHFDTALSLHELTGVLYCFDFQEDAMRQVCGPNVKIQSLDFAVVKALLRENNL